MTLRERQSEQARRLITRAAHDLFLEMGYIGTTMDDIAESAGVARRTIYNQLGSKAAVLVAVIEVQVEGADVRSRDRELARFRELSDADEIIDHFITASAGVMERTLPVLRIAYEAAVVDGEVAKLLEMMEERRYQAQRILLDQLQTAGHLRSDVPFEYLMRGFWMLASPRLALTSSRAGWDTDTYLQWLRETVRGLLVASKG